MNTQMSSIDAAEAQRQTERIAASRVFANAKRSQRLLRYLVDAAIADPTQAVKEYTLATDVFDRDDSYDPAVDATVRVEAGRLRTRLREYYGEEGGTDRLLIEVPRGAYRAVLTLRGEAAHSANSIAAISDEAPSPAPRAELPREKPSAGWRTLPRSWSSALLATIVGVALGYAGWRLAHQRRPQANTRSLAVLPLKNLSGDPAQDYFADGTTDELITELARVPGLRVVSWNSVVQEKDTKKPLREIAEELRADLLVEGSVSRSGEMVRINAQLIDTRNDGHLWANSFEGPLSEVMILESKAADEIVSHARVGIYGPESTGLVRPLPAIDPAAHDAYLRGKNYFDKRLARASAEEFQRAIDLSPSYAPAYAGLAEALQSEALTFVATPEQVLPKAMGAAKRALELDPANGDALIARGSIETTFLWQWDEAEHDLRHGIALSPNNSYGHMMLSVYLDSIGKPDDAVKEMQEAVQIDPLSFFMARHLGSALVYARRYDEALQQLLYAREMHPATAAFVDAWISEAYWKKGMSDDAVRYDLLGLQESKQVHDEEKLLAAYHHNGWQGYWLARLEGLHRDISNPCDSYEAGILAVRAGRHGEAIEELKQATGQHCYWMGPSLVDPVLDEVRGEPGFSVILADLHLPPVTR